MAFCANCGAEIPEGAGFCGNCGAPAPVPQAQPEEVQESEQMNAEPVNRRSYAPQVPQAPQAPQAYRAPRAPRAPRNVGPAPKNQKTLRILSIVFAVGFLFFFIGLGGRIYTGRVVGKYNDSLVVKTEYGTVGEKLKNSEKNILIEKTAAIARGDAKALYNTELKAYRLRNSDLKNDAYYQAMVKVPPTKEQVKELKESIRNVTDGAHDAYGFNWTMLTLGAHYSFFMWFGGILAVVSLGCWIAMGGCPNNFLQATFWPALCAAFVLALTFMILDLALDANMNDLIRKFLYMSV